MIRPAARCTASAAIRTMPSSSAAACPTSTIRRCWPGARSTSGSAASIPRYRIAMDYDWLLRADRAGFRGVYEPRLVGAHDARRRLGPALTRELSPKSADRDPPWPAADAAWPLYAFRVAKGGGRSGRSAAAAGRSRVARRLVNCSYRPYRPGARDGNTPRPRTRADAGARTGAPALLARVVALSAVKMPLEVPALLQRRPAAARPGHADRAAVAAALVPLAVRAGRARRGRRAPAHSVCPTAGRASRSSLLIVAASLSIARLDPALLARYLAVLLSVMIWSRWSRASARAVPHPPISPACRGPSPGRAGRRAQLQRHALRRIGVILAQHRPRVLGLMPFLLAVPVLSRGVFAAAAAWLGCLPSAAAAPGWRSLLVVLLCLQPLLMLAFDARSTTRYATRAHPCLRASRYGLWLGYAEWACASTPFGVGYFEGEARRPYRHHLPRGLPGALCAQRVPPGVRRVRLARLSPVRGFLLHVTLLAARAAPQAAAGAGLHPVRLLVGQRPLRLGVLGAIGYVLACASRVPRHRRQEPAVGRSCRRSPTAGSAAARPTCCS